MSAPVYVILTSKPGQFRTDLVEGLRRVESWEYRAAGRIRALFVIAQLHQAAKIKIVDETPPEVVNHISSKVLEKFASVELAREALRQLVSARASDCTLVQL